MRWVWIEVASVKINQNQKRSIKATNPRLKAFFHLLVSLWLKQKSWKILWYQSLKKYSIEPVPLSILNFIHIILKLTKSQWSYKSFIWSHTKKKALGAFKAFMKSFRKKDQSSYLSQNESLKSVRPKSGLVLLFDFPSQWIHVQNEYCDPYTLEPPSMPKPSSSK